jgi:hypothetical protein
MPKGKTKVSRREVIGFRPRVHELGPLKRRLDAFQRRFPKFNRSQLLRAFLELGMGAVEAGDDDVLLRVVAGCAAEEAPGG